MQATTRRFQSLRELVQAMLSDLPRADVCGLAVVLPSEQRLDVYTRLGLVADRRPEFLRTLAWIAAFRKDDSWQYSEINSKLREEFIKAMEAIPT